MLHFVAQLFCAHFRQDLTPGADVGLGRMGTERFYRATAAKLGFFFLIRALRLAPTFSGCYSSFLASDFGDMIILETNCLLDNA